MTASLSQSQYAQGETGNNERFSTPAVRIILGTWHLESSAETKILKLTIDFLNLLNIKTFSSSKIFLNGDCGKSWGWERHLEIATKNWGQNTGRVFASMDRKKKKNMLGKLRGKFLTDNGIIVQKYFPQTHIKGSWLFYYSKYQDNFLKKKTQKTVTLANNVSLSSVLANLLDSNRCYLLYVKRLDYEMQESE